MLYRISATLCAVVVSLAFVGPAYAHFCSVAKKPATAGAVGVVDITNGNFTLLKKNPGTEEKPHGAFVALTDGEFSTSAFIRVGPGVLPPAQPGGSQDNCDGKGLDSLVRCFGG